MDTKRKSLKLAGVQIQNIWRNQIKALLQNPDQLDTVLGDYDGPSGNPEFLNKLAES